PAHGAGASCLPIRYSQCLPPTPGQHVDAAGVFLGVVAAVQNRGAEEAALGRGRTGVEPQQAEQETPEAFRRHCHGFLAMYLKVYGAYLSCASAAMLPAPA